tara:strand:- start:13 stop:426 length:414 start_codon:yes stop_codon:yes gene_type:complete
MMAKDEAKISLNDLESLRTAPSLSKLQSIILFQEVIKIIEKADWLTIGIMAPSIKVSLESVREIEKKLKLKKMNCVDKPKGEGPIFLKANQKTGEIRLRIEFGLGEGILISCHHFDNSITSKTIGPFPLDFFKQNNL